MVGSLGDEELRAHLQDRRAKVQIALRNMQRAETILAALQQEVDVARNEIARRGGGSAVHRSVAALTSTTRQRGVTPLVASSTE